MEHSCTAVWDPREAARLGYGAVALRYQRLGLAVLGTRAGVKIPHQAYGSEGGYQWATTDERMVPWLWERDRHAGVAIATGSRSGLMVVDLDVKGGARGDVSWCGQFGGWPLMPGQPYSMVITPSGGWHLWFRTPPGGMIPTRPGILPGVDIKAAGGYVLAPPSQVRVDSMVRSDGSLGGVLLPYRWAEGCCACRVPEAPPWLLDWARSAQATGSPHGGSGEPVPDVSELVAGGGLQPGSRNITLHRLACSLFRKYGTRPAGQEETRRQLDLVLAETSLAGFSQGERERTIRSALEWARDREAEDMEAGEAFSR
jgi:hypothetical protein